MKFHGRDTRPETDRTLKPESGQRGDLAPQTPDGSVAGVSAALIKGFVALAAAAGCYWRAPSFEGWSFGDDFPGKKLRFAAWMMTAVFGVGGCLNIAAALGGCAKALFGR